MGRRCVSQELCGRLIAEETKTMTPTEWFALAVLAAAGSLYGRAVWSLYGRFCRLDEKVISLADGARREEAKVTQTSNRIQEHERRIVVLEHEMK